MLRLGNTCGVRLPDRVVAEADTVQDLIDAILRENPGAPPTSASANSNLGAIPTAPSATAAAAAAPAPVRPDLEEQIRKAETLTEIFRLQSRVVGTEAGTAMRTPSHKAGNTDDQRGLCNRHDHGRRTVAHHGFERGVVLLHGG